MNPNPPVIWNETDLRNCVLYQRGTGVHARDHLGNHHWIARTPTGGIMAHPVRAGRGPGDRYGRFGPQ